jgi:hypothetical protein
VDGNHRHRNTVEGGGSWRRPLRGEPKNLALTLAAAASIAEAELDQADKAIAIAVFIAWDRSPLPVRCSSTS